MGKLRKIKEQMGKGNNIQVNENDGNDKGEIFDVGDNFSQNIINFFYKRINHHFTYISLLLDYSRSFWEQSHNPVLEPKKKSSYGQI